MAQRDDGDWDDVDAGGLLDWFLIIWVNVNDY